jgi:hypothetical protein
MHSSETPAVFDQPTQHIIPESLTLHQHCHQNLKYGIISLMLISCWQNNSTTCEAKVYLGIQVPSLVAGVCQEGEGPYVPRFCNQRIGVSVAYVFHNTITAFISIDFSALPHEYSLPSRFLGNCLSCSCSLLHILRYMTRTFDTSLAL